MRTSTIYAILASALVSSVAALPVSTTGALGAVTRHVPVTALTDDVTEIVRRGDVLSSLLGQYQLAFKMLYPPLTWYTDPTNSNGNDDKASADDSGDGSGSDDAAGNGDSAGDDDSASSGNDDGDGNGA